MLIVTFRINRTLYEDYPIDGQPAIYVIIRHFLLLFQLLNYKDYILLRLYGVFREKANEFNK